MMIVFILSTKILHSLNFSDSPQIHRLHLCVAELLAASLSASPAPCVSSHPWAAPGERDISFQERVRGVWAEQFGVSSAGSWRPDALLQELRSVEVPTPTASVSLKQVGLWLWVFPGETGVCLTLSLLCHCRCFRLCCTRRFTWPACCWARCLTVTLMTVTSWWRSCGERWPGSETSLTSVFVRKSARCSFLTVRLNISESSTCFYVINTFHFSAKKNTRRNETFWWVQMLNICFSLIPVKKISALGVEVWKCSRYFTWIKILFLKILSKEHKIWTIKRNKKAVLSCFERTNEGLKLFF